MVMAEHDPSSRIGLIPCAVGGTSIRKWQPGAEDEKTNTHPYDDMLKRLQIARRSGSLKGMLWHQGESDGKMGMAGTYEEALTELIDRLRAECGDPRGSLRDRPIGTVCPTTLVRGPHQSGCSATARVGAGRSHRLCLLRGIT